MGAPFDGFRYRNPPAGGAPPPKGSLRAFVRWRLTRKAGTWRRLSEEEAPPGPPPPERVERGLRVTFVGHATTLIQQDGLNLLTDPIWSERCSPVSFAGPRRYRPPGLRFEDLPPIDAVMISHNHYDHLDVPTLRRLIEAHRPLVVAPLGNQRFLVRRGLQPATELDWWQDLPLEGGAELTCVPARHFSGRGLRDRNRTLWGGFALRSTSATTYFAGDTGAGDHFAEIGRRFGPIDLALLPIGAYEPRWFMCNVHINPEEAVEAHLALGARASVAIHFGTFELSDEGQDRPVEDLTRALEENPAAAGAFYVLDHGEGRDLINAEPSASLPRADS